MTQGNEAALELSQYGHGLLTYAHVEEGLKQGKADNASKDGQILLREWLDYTTIRLPERKWMACSAWPLRLAQRPRDTTSSRVLSPRI
jgi:hypothetical protein